MTFRSKDPFARTSACGYCKCFQNPLRTGALSRTCKEGKEVQATNESCSSFERQDTYYCPLEARDSWFMSCQYGRQLLHLECISCFNFANDPPFVRRRKDGIKDSENDTIFECDYLKIPTNKTVCRINKDMLINQCVPCDILDEYRRPKR